MTLSSAPRSRLLVAALAAALVIAPHGLPADEPADEPLARPELGEGLSLLGEGARLILRGLMDELDLAMRDLGVLVDDMSIYHAPEVLPNGDILIRRKVPLVPENGEDEAPPLDGPGDGDDDGEIEL